MKANKQFRINTHHFSDLLIVCCIGDENFWLIIMYLMSLMNVYVEFLWLWVLLLFETHSIDNLLKYLRSRNFHVPGVGSLIGWSHAVPGVWASASTLSRPLSPVGCLRVVPCSGGTEPSKGSGQGYKSFCWAMPDVCGQLGEWVHTPQ